MLGSNTPITPEPSRTEPPQPPKPKKPLTPPRTDTFRKTLRSSEAPPSKEEAEQAGIEEKESESPSLFDLQKKGKSKGKSSLEKKPGSKGEEASVERRPLPADVSEEKTPIFLTPKTTEGEEELITFGEDEGEEEIEEESEFLQPKSKISDGLRPKEKEGHGLKPKEKGTQELPSQNKGLPSENELPEQPILEPMYSPANKEGIPKKSFEPAQEAPPEQMQKSAAEPAIPREVIVQQMIAQQQMGAEIKSKGTKESSSTEKKESSDVSKKEKSKGESRTQAEGELGKGAAMGGVNASIQGAGFFSEAAEQTEAKRSSTIKEIVSQIVDKIQVMRKDKQTTTTITLKHPPILKGATIILTTSDQAKREFNITFANLSPNAKAFLDRKLKEDSLTDSLEKRGIIIHQLTTTTESSRTIASQDGQPARDQQEKEQQRRQQQFEEEDEGEGVT